MENARKSITFIGCNKLFSNKKKLKSKISKIGFLLFSFRIKFPH